MSGVWTLFLLALRVWLSRVLWWGKSGLWELDFDLGIVGLDCEDGLALADWLTGLFMAVNDFALAHRMSELGHLHRCRRWVAGGL